MSSVIGETIIQEINIPYPEFNCETIRKIFSKVGNVTDCYVNTKNINGRFTYGLITYENDLQALQAIDEFNRMDVGNNIKIGVQIAKNKREDNSNGTKNNDANIGRKSFLCSICETPCTTKCSRCLKVAYCGQACQKLDYATHKTDCKVWSVKNNEFNTNENKNYTNGSYVIPSHFQTQKNVKFSTSVPLVPLRYKKEKYVKRLCLPVSEYKLSVMYVKPFCYFYACPENENINRLRSEVAVKLSEIDLLRSPELDCDKLYCVLENGIRRRAIVLDHVSHQYAKFLLIDVHKKIYCHINDTFPIYDEKLQSIPPLCIKCVFTDSSLYDKYFSTGSVTHYDTIELLFLCSIDDIYMFREISSKPKSYCPPNLLVNSIYDMNLSVTNNCDNVTMWSTCILAKSINTALWREYDSMETKSFPSEYQFSLGEYLMARLSDGLWKRAVVFSIESCFLHVLFLDTANDIQKISLDNVAQMPLIHQYFPPTRIRCRLSPNTSSSLKYTLLESSRRRKEGIPSKIKVISVNDEHIHCIEVLSIDLNTVYTNPLEHKKSISPEFKYKLISVPFFADLSVNVSHFNSVQDFYIQIARKDYTNTLISINNDIEQEMSNLLNVLPVESAIVGIPVMCRNEAGWFRAIITQIDDSDSEYTVFFVDFGMTDIVPISSLAQMNPKFLENPMQSIPCCVDDSQLANHPNLCELLQQCPSKLKLKFTSKNSIGRYTIKLIQLS